MGGCDIHAAFDSPTGLIYPAQDTGRLSVRTNATVHEVTVDPATGKARGVAFVDTVTGKSYEARAKAVVLAASTLESARLLLLSKSRQHPNGIGNSSGLVGHHFCEHLMGPHVTGLVKDRVGATPTLDDGRPGGFYVPRFRNLTDKQPDFIRGYGFEGEGGFDIGPGEGADAPGFGKAWKKHVRDYAGAYISMGGFGEVLPRYENSVSLDPVVKDRWGIPVLKFDYQFGDNERKMAADMAQQAQEMFEAAGIEVVSVGRNLLTEGWSIHELGTARMGDDPEDLGAEPVPAVPRRRQSSRRRRQQPRERVVPEPDVDDHGSRDAVLRAPGGSDEEGRAVMEDRRTEVTRRDLLKAAGAAAMAAPLVVGDPLAAAAAAAAEAPKFFTRDQWALVDELAEIVIPADEHSGGARAAKVVNAIDGWLAEAFEPDPKKQWVDGLARVNALARETKGGAFMQLMPDDRGAVVTLMAEEEGKPVSVEGHFFNELKRRTSHFYYTSKIGIHDELEYKGNVLQDEYAGIDVSKEGTN